MSTFRNPFDPNVKLNGCSCGRHHSQAEHDQAEALSEEAMLDRVVEGAVMRALFPHDETRRNFIRAVGASTAMAAGRWVCSPPMKWKKASVSPPAGPAKMLRPVSRSITE